MCSIGGAKLKDTKSFIDDDCGLGDGPLPQAYFKGVLVPVKAQSLQVRESHAFTSYATSSKGLEKYF
jgi:hypothetical protein